MNFESPAEPLPELRKSRNPSENKNHDFLVQARLMARSPLPEMEWAERFAAAFRTLFDTDHEFRDLVNGPIDDDSLKRTQETLDRFVEQH